MIDHAKTTHDRLVCATAKREKLIWDIEVLNKQIALLEKADLDDKKPKKICTSGYILFSNAIRHEVRDQLTVHHVKPKNSDIMKELGRLWRELSDENKKSWNAKAKEIKEQVNKKDQIFSN